MANYDEVLEEAEEVQPQITQISQIKNDTERQGAMPTPRWA